MFQNNTALYRQLLILPVIPAFSPIFSFADYPRFPRFLLSQIKRCLYLCCAEETTVKCRVILGRYFFSTLLLVFYEYRCLQMKIWEVYDFLNLTVGHMQAVDNRTDQNRKYKSQPAYKLTDILYFVCCTSANGFFFKKCDERHMPVVYGISCKVLYMYSTRIYRSKGTQYRYSCIIRSNRGCFTEIVLTFITVFGK